MGQRKNVFSIIGLLLIIGSLSAYGQDRSIRGQVYDFSTRKPLSFVHALLFSKDTTQIVQGGTTSVDGSFTFENLNEDSYTIKLLFIGYSDIKRKIEFASGNEVDLGIIYMNESAQSLNNIEVIVERNTIVQKSNKTILNINEGLSQSS